LAIFEIRCSPSYIFFFFVDLFWPGTNPPHLSLPSNSDYRHVISLAVSDLYWIQNLRGHLATLAVGNVDSMSRLYHWAMKTTVIFSICEMVPLFGLLKPVWWGWSGSQDLSELSCLFPVRWFTLAHSPCRTSPHQNLRLPVYVVMAGIPWTL
jgi:hypothetical protein